MKYSNQYVDKVVDYTYPTKKKIDMLLELDATQYCNLGIDSTKQQKEEVKRCHQPEKTERSLGRVFRERGNHGQISKERALEEAHYRLSTD